MSSRNLLNLVLLLVVVILAAVVILQPGKTPEAGKQTLTSLSGETINHIYVTRDTGADIELEKSATGWQMHKPYQLPATEFRVQSLLRLLNTESFARHPLDSLDKNTYGLAEPRATISFNHQHKISFGDNEPLQQHRYVAYDNTLQLVSDTFYYQLASRATTFLDHGLLAGQKDIRELDLPYQTIELVDGKWVARNISRWHTAQAVDSIHWKKENFSADAVADLLTRWRNTRAVEMKPVKNVTQPVTVQVFFKSTDKPIMFAVSNNSLIRKDIGMEYVLTESSIKSLLSVVANETVTETTNQ